MKFISRDDVIMVNGIPPKMTDKDRVAIDTEFFNMVDGKLHRPHGDFAWLGCSKDGRTVYYITDQSQIPAFYSAIEEAVHIYHNSLFDLGQMRRFASIPDRKRLWDTMLVEQIMYRGYYDLYSLADLARRYLDIFLPKDERDTFKENSELVMDDKQLFYSACDVVATWQIYQEQIKFVSTNDVKIWKEIELPMVWNILSMGGAPIDSVAWIAIAREKEERAKTLWDSMQEKYGINLRSVPQVKAALAKDGIIVKSTSKDVLESLAGKHELIDTILEFRKPAKGASTYGMAWLEENVEEDGKVYTSWKQMGTKTTRFSSSNPNLQNIPVRTEAVYRECFVASPGHKIVTFDYSSQEPRIMAFLAGDERLMQIFNDGLDIYIETGFDVFNERFDKSSPRRDEMKALVLGLNYGMTEYGLSERLGTSLEYAKQLIEKFFTAYPKVYNYIQEQVFSMRRNGYVNTITNRKLWITKYSWSSEREAPNYPIQGSASDALKISSNRISEYFRHKYSKSPIILLVHDEIVADVPEEWLEEYLEVGRSIMEKVAEELHPGIIAKADGSYGDNWGQAKKG